MRIVTAALRSQALHLYDGEFCVCPSWSPVCRLSREGNTDDTHTALAHHPYRPFAGYGRTRPECTMQDANCQMSKRASSSVTRLLAIRPCGVYLYADVSALEETWNACCWRRVWRLACACDANGPSALSAPTPANRGAATPTVTAISPNVGSTSGDTPIVIMGTGFQPGVTATFDSVPVAARFDSRYADRIYLATPPHAAGTVDVLVTNAAASLVGLMRVTRSRYRVVRLQWDVVGVSLRRVRPACRVHHSEQWAAQGVVRCIGRLVLAAAACHERSVLFSQDGSTITGKIVSASQATGAITLAPCGAPLWQATRKP